MSQCVPSISQSQVSILGQLTNARPGLCHPGTNAPSGPWVHNPSNVKFVRKCQNQPKNSLNEGTFWFKRLQNESEERILREYFPMARTCVHTHRPDFTFSPS